MNYLKILLTIGVVWGFFGSPDLNAQYIIHQVEYRIPISYDLLPEGQEFANPGEEARFFLQLPEEKLKAALPPEEANFQQTETVIAIDGNNIAVESQSEEGKITMVSDIREKKFYLIYWPMKKVIVMTREDLEKVQQQARNFADKMLEGLSPEMRKQIEAEMEKEKSARSRPWKVETTGVKGSKYGFNCEQYIAERPEEIVLIWASEDYPEIVEKSRKISEQFQAAFPDEDSETDEWELVEGKIPVEVRRFERDEMGNPVISVMAINRIEKKRPPSKIFMVPGPEQGFTRVSMQEFMQQMMPFEQQ